MGLGPSDESMMRLRNELLLDILSNPSSAPPVEIDQIRAVLNQYRETQADMRAARERQRRETIIYDVFTNRPDRTSNPTRPINRFGPTDFRDSRSAERYAGDHTCPRCGQDTRYVQFCSPRSSGVSSEDKAYRLNFDSDSVIDGEVLDGVVELDRPQDVD